MLFIPMVLAAKVPPSECGTKIPIQEYKEWREIGEFQQQKYLAAIQCLTKPGTNKIQNRKGTVQPNTDFVTPQHNTRMDDFVYEYYVNYREYGFLRNPFAPFLPFHRAIVRLYDQALTSECKYTGPIPYWDWTLDSKNPAASPVWAAFGGIGTFENWKTAYPELHSLSRKSNQLSTALTLIQPNVVAHYLKTGEFEELRRDLDSLSSKIHESIGGDMAKIESALADPLALLHYRNIDRLWAKWQAKNWFNAVAYKGVMWDKINRRYYRVSLDNYVVRDPTTSSYIKVGDVMNIKSGALNGLMCYHYVDPDIKTIQRQVMNVLNWNVGDAARNQWQRFRK